MTLLVTGGAGFIGSNYVRRRRRLHPQERLVVLDALTYAGNLQSLDDVQGFEFVKGDICDLPLVEKVLKDYAVERVVHFAAETHVDRSIHGPADFIRTNVQGTATMLQASRAAGVKRFVHVSTDEVYGSLGPDDPAFSEETPVSPRSPYSASKTGSDYLASAWFHTYGFPTLITRCSNNYGPYQFPEKLIPLMISNAMANKELPVYGDGQNVRDWLHVDDHCSAIDAVLEKGRAGEVYNIGGKSERKNLDVVSAILQILDKPKSLIKFVADRPGHDRRYAIDSRKIERELGWTPEHTFEKGLAETIRWYQDHQQWIEAVKSGSYQDWYRKNYLERGHG